MTKLPEFLCVGGPKCGTTSLYEYLRQHPDIFLPDQKELHYFSYPELAERPNGPGMRHILAGLISTEAAYRAQYAKARPDQVAGDLSPSYLANIAAIHGIKQLLGAPKIIILLRNPVERAFSQYMHLRRSAREDQSFEDALSAEGTRRDERWGDMWMYRQSGLSADFVAAYLEAFSKNNVRIYLSDDLRRNTRAVLDDILEFIGVSTNVEIDLSGEFNRSGLPKSPLVARMLDASLAANFAKMILPRRLGSKTKHLLQSANTGEKLLLDPETRQNLEDFYRPDIKALETVIGRETGWVD